MVWSVGSGKVAAKQRECSGVVLRVFIGGLRAVYKGLWCMVGRSKLHSSNAKGAA